MNVTPFIFLIFFSLSLSAKIHQMDHYIVNIDQDPETEVLITYLELPFSIEKNKPLAIKAFDFKNGKLVPLKITLPSGIHVRNMYTSPEGKLYFLDHGHDTYPFPGGPVFSFDIKTQAIKKESKEDRFYFNGDAVKHPKGILEARVGLKFIEIFLNGEPHLKVNQALEKVPHFFKGFLAAKFFNSPKGIALYLGEADSDEKKSARDYIVYLQDLEKPEVKIISKYLDKDWGTVQVIKEDIDHDGFDDFYLLNHNHGYFRGMIARALSSKGYQFEKVYHPQKVLQNHWFKDFVKYKENWYFLIRTGSKEKIKSKCGIGKINPKREVTLFDNCAHGFFVRGDEIYFLSNDAVLYPGLEYLRTPVSDL